MTTAPTTTISTEELAEKLHSIKGAAFVTFIIESKIKTLAKSRVTKNPTPSNISEGKKRSVIFGIIGGKYSNAVNNQRDRENIPSDFEPQDHKWASYIDDSPVMQHNNSGDLYLAIQRRPAKNTNKTVYTDANGSHLAYDDIAEYLKAKSPSSGQSQGIDNPIQWLTLKLENVTEARINGVVYMVNQPKPMNIVNLRKRLGQNVAATN